MSLAALVAWATANETLLLTIAFLLSEALGANPNIKSNGFLSFLLIRVQDFLKGKGAKTVK